MFTWKINSSIKNLDSGYEKFHASVSYILSLKKIIRVGKEIELTLFIKIINRFERNKIIFSVSVNEQ